MSYRGESFARQIEFVVEECCNCGMPFAMTKEFQKRKLDARLSNDKTFYCPAGHPQHYTGETEATKLRRERDRLAQRIAYKDDRINDLEKQRDHESARARGYMGYAAKLSKRAKGGVCPCCNRHFEQLERHMTSKHPNFEGVTADG